MLNNGLHLLKMADFQCLSEVFNSSVPTINLNHDSV